MNATFVVFVCLTWPYSCPLDDPRTRDLRQHHQPDDDVNTIDEEVDCSVFDVDGDDDFLNMLVIAIIPLEFSLGVIALVT